MTRAAARCRRRRPRRWALDAPGRVIHEDEDEYQVVVMPEAGLSM
ncbi:hypothetical protein ACWEPR_02845 [Streptomyces sp. NPDC004290]